MTVAVLLLFDRESCFHAGGVPGEYRAVLIPQGESLARPARIFHSQETLKKVPRLRMVKVLSDESQALRLLNHSQVGARTETDESASLVNQISEPLPAESAAESGGRTRNTTGTEDEC